MLSTRVLPCYLTLLVCSRPVRASHNHQAFVKHTAQPHRSFGKRYNLCTQASRAPATAASMNTYPKPLVFEARGNHTATVFILHGLGDTAAGWADFAPMLQAKLPFAKFVLPTAPTRPISLNGGMLMTGWYDITSLDKITAKEDVEGERESAKYLEGLLAAEQQESGIPQERMVVMGFSQGGAMALLSLRFQAKVAAVLGLSSYLVLAEDPPLVSDTNKRTPLLMCHGDMDQVVKYEYGKASFEKLKAAGANADFRTYKHLQHGVDPQEVQDALDNLESNLKPFLNKAPKELEQNLSALERAELHGVLAEAHAALFAMYLQAQGANPEDHPFAKEKAHVEKFLRKVKKVAHEKELKEAQRVTEVNVGAANRFISHALPDLSKAQKRQLREAGKEHDRLHEEKVGKARKGSATDSPQAVGSADVTQKAEAFLASFMTDKGAEQQL